MGREGESKRDIGEREGERRECGRGRKREREGREGRR